MNRARLDESIRACQVERADALAEMKRCAQILRLQNESLARWQGPITIEDLDHFGRTLDAEYSIMKDALRRWTDATRLEIECCRERTAS